MNMNKLKMGGAAVILTASMLFAGYQYAKTGEMGRALERYKLQNERSDCQMNGIRPQRPAYQHSFVLDTALVSLNEEKENHSRLMMIGIFTVLVSIGYLSKKWVEYDLTQKK